MLQELFGKFNFKSASFGLCSVKMPREEVDGSVGFLCGYVLEEAVHIRHGKALFNSYHSGCLLRLSARSYRMRIKGIYVIKSRGCVAAHFNVRKAFFQMVCRDSVKLEKFLLCAAPVWHRGGCALGLIPNLPILDSHMESVCPALVIMSYYMLADLSPLIRVLRRKSV